MMELRYYNKDPYFLVYSFDFSDECPDGSHSPYQKFVHFFEKARYYADKVEYKESKNAEWKEIKFDE